MPFKTILAVIQGKADAERVLDCAVPLASRFESHVIGVHAEPLPVAYSSQVGFPDAAYLESASEINRERAAELRAIFERRTREAGLPSEWQGLETFSGDSAISALSSARASDIVIAAQPDPDLDAIASADVESLLFDSGRPVLLTPHAGPTITTYRRIIVAWNGSREAARATFDALPFILNADHTEVLVVGQGEDVDTASETGGAIAAALARHGAEVAVHRRNAGSLSIEEAIQVHVAESGADLLVLGAYSHSWLREFLFGGVTRSMLKTMPVTSFMSR